MLKDFFSLIKPGIIFGNALSGIAGFFLAYPLGSFYLFLFMLLGLSLIIASACAFNNIWDKNIDSQMKRTQNRTMVLNKIPKKIALIYAYCLLLCGILILYFFTNKFSLLAALIGFIVYVLIYTPLKRKTIHGTLIGAVSGAMPPVVGYTAATNSINEAAVIVFFILLFWQMPHFYAIGVYRLNDYIKANIPILPAKKGLKRTKIEILLYCLAFSISAVALWFLNFAGPIYLITIIFVSLAWLYLSLKTFFLTDNPLWAKKMFLFSLLVLIFWCAIIPIDKLINNL